VAKTLMRHFPHVFELKISPLITSAQQNVCANFVFFPTAFYVTTGNSEIYTDINSMSASENITAFLQNHQSLTGNISLGRYNHHHWKASPARYKIPFY